MCCLVGAFRYDEMLFSLGYKTMQHTLTSLERFRFGVVFMVTYILALGAMILCVQGLKYSIKRARPKLDESNKRYGSLRKAEEGTYSMPSGDCAAVALYCFLHCTMVWLPAMYLILPLVAVGRVYY